MFSYQHRYHAGNFADVHKHLILIALLNHLHKKPTPFGVLDSYAGEGIYDLQCAESQKLGEYEDGILNLLKSPHLPPLAQQLRTLIQTLNKDQETRYYPGSPKIIAHYLRAQDSAHFVEGHSQAFAHLQKNLKKGSFHLHKRDALESLISLVPLKEKRGLIFLDPSYEVKTEYKDVGLQLAKSFHRFGQGIYALWYPLIVANYHQQLLKTLQRLALPKIWHCQWLPNGVKSHPIGIYGSGMIIINTPWQVDSIVTQTFTTLNSSLFKQGKFFHEWLS